MSSRPALLTAVVPTVRNLTLGRWTLLCLTGVWLTFAAVRLLLVTQSAAGIGQIGDDFRLYREAGEHWLATGAFYFPEQLAPHAPVIGRSVYYPPHALLVLAPLALLPIQLAAVIWWAVPLVVLGYALWRWRPALSAWPVIAVILSWPATTADLVYGNSDLWIAAVIAGGLLWAWPGVLITLKPAFLPLALIGAGRRRWWRAAALLAVLCVPFGGLWSDYFVVMQNVQGLDLRYRLLTMPILFLGVVAWAARRDASGREVWRPAWSNAALAPATRRLAAALGLISHRWRPALLARSAAISPEPALVGVMAQPGDPLLEPDLFPLGIPIGSTTVPPQWAPAGTGSGPAEPEPSEETSSEEVAIRR